MNEKTMSKLIIALLNRTGNVGKTMLSDQLFAPVLGARTVRFETINQTGTGPAADVDAHVRDFRPAATAIMNSQESVVIDFGSTQSEALEKLLRTYSFFKQSIDAFIVPVLPIRKQMTNSLATIDALLDMNVEPERITALANNIEDEHERSAYQSLELDLQNRQVRFVFGVHRNEILERLQDSDRSKSETVFDIAESDIDSVIEQANREKEAGHSQESARFFARVMDIDLARTAVDNFRDVFDGLSLPLKSQRS